MDKRTVLDSLVGFPPELAEYVKGTGKEEIELDARKLMALWVKDRNVVDNKKKVTGVPATSARRPAASLGAKELAGKTLAERREWAGDADDETFLQLVREQQEKKQ